MSDLMAFLRARLDEDEAAARAWLPFGNPDAAAREHAARYDPARVLRDVEAKRALIDEHGPPPESPRACQRCITDREDFAESWPWDSYPCETLRILAAVYSDHRDYRQEWKP